MGLTNVWKEKREPLTWRHFVLAAFWAITVIPMIVLVGAAWLAERADPFFGQLRTWANPESYGKGWRDSPSNLR